MAGAPTWPLWPGAFIGRLGKDHNPFNINIHRNPQWPHPDSKVELTMQGIVAEWLFEPSAQARADEIIAAYDQWRTRENKKPRRLVTAERKRDNANDLMMELEEQIAETPATSITGMIAKARCVQTYAEGCQPETDDPVAIFSASIARDRLALKVRS